MANHKTFHLVVKTPERTAFEGETVSIKLRAENGQMQVFANHASITASIIFSNIVIETTEGEEKYVVRRGTFAFNNDTNTATLLTTYCEKESEMDIDTAKDYLKFIEEQLAAGKDLSKFQLVYLENEKLAIEKQIA